MPRTNHNSKTIRFDAIDKAILLELQGNSGLRELQAIDAALGRIESGTYGICFGCKEEISEERLEAVPYATKCRNCM